MEPKSITKTSKRLYLILYLMEQKPEMFHNDDYTLNSLEYFIDGYTMAAFPDLLENDNSPSFIYFNDWLKGHLPTGIDTSLSWSAQIRKRNAGNEKKAFEEFFNLLRIFNASILTFLEAGLGNKLIPEVKVASTVAVNGPR